MESNKKSKLSEIKGTVSDATELMRLIGNSEVMESLNKVKDTAKTVNEIIQSLNTPQMVKNVENFRLISENMNLTSVKIESTMNQLQETNVMDDVSSLIKSIKNKMDAFDDSSDGLSGQDLKDVSIASKEMILSVKNMIDEIALCIETSKKSTTAHNINHTINEVSKIPEMMR